jgi:hypothetical protein
MTNTLQVQVSTYSGLALLALALRLHLPSTSPSALASSSYKQPAIIAIDATLHALKADTVGNTWLAALTTGVPGIHMLAYRRASKAGRANRVVLRVGCFHSCKRGRMVERQFHSLPARNPRVRRRGRGPAGAKHMGRGWLRRSLPRCARAVPRPTPSHDCARPHSTRGTTRRRIRARRAERLLPHTRRSPFVSVHSSRQACTA